MLTPEESDFCLRTLQDLVSKPTASFHEYRVKDFITGFLSNYGIPFNIDRWGNIIAHYRNGQNIRPLALVAHTDHPSFELIARGAEVEAVPGKPVPNWTGKLLGGVYSACFAELIPVRLLKNKDETYNCNGTITGYRVTEAKDPEVILYLHIEDDSGLEAGDFGVWDLPDFYLEGPIIHARALDDLAGCAATLLTLWKLVQAKAEANVYGILTRAEEVGLVGAEAVFGSGSIPAETLVVSIEASKRLPGAAQGEGPVIRTGDRANTFDDQAEFILRAAAETLGGDVVTRKPQTTKVQRQLLTGGRCEAGTAKRYGYLATGLAFPLGNYHNMQDDTTTPRIVVETIHQQDFLTGIDLLQQATLLMPGYDSLVKEAGSKIAAPTDLIKRLEDTTG